MPGALHLILDTMISQHEVPTLQILGNRHGVIIADLFLYNPFNSRFAAASTLLSVD